MNIIGFYLFSYFSITYCTVLNPAFGLQWIFNKAIYLSLKLFSKHLIEFKLSSHFNLLLLRISRGTETYMTPFTTGCTFTKMSFPICKKKGRYFKFKVNIFKLRFLANHMIYSVNRSRGKFDF